MSNCNSIPLCAAMIKVTPSWNRQNDIPSDLRKVTQHLQMSTPEGLLVVAVLLLWHLLALWPLGSDEHSPTTLNTNQHIYGSLLLHLVYFRIAKVSDFFFLCFDGCESRGGLGEFFSLREHKYRNINCWSTQTQTLIFLQNTQYVNHAISRIRVINVASPQMDNLLFTSIVLPIFEILLVFPLKMFGLSVCVRRFILRRNWWATFDIAFVKGAWFASARCFMYISYKRVTSFLITNRTQET